MTEKITSLDDLESHVFVHEPDHKLRKKIGVPLSQVFTKQRIQTAEKVVEAKAVELIGKCTNDAVKMKQIFVRVQNEKNIATPSYTELKLLALSTKGAAGMGGYPLSSEIARSMYEYMDKLKALDDKALSIIGFHIDSIYAIFSENRRDVQDTIAQQVITELRKVSKA